MILWPYAVFLPFLFSAKSCAGETNACHPCIHVRSHRHFQTPRNCVRKLVQAIKMQIMTKSGKKWHIFTKENRLKNYFWWVFGHVWTKFFMLFHFLSTLSMNCIFLGQKSSTDFFPNFTPFFTTMPTSESCNDPPKVLTEGSMVEYLPVGTQEAPKTIIGKRKIPAPHS